jgi:SagB-type dehydrogenase family enzyme
MSNREKGIGDQYHFKTTYRREDMRGGRLDWATRPSPYKEEPRGLKRFSPLPPLKLGGKSLWEAIAIRRSSREFTPRPLTFSEICQLIWATQGITQRSRGYDFRATPSAGALYPIETYVVVNRVEDLSSGIYHYSVKESQLVLLKEGSFGREVSRAGLDQEMLERAAAVFIWTAVVVRSKWKYRERAYRYIYMDAGHVGQNLYLGATALGVGCCTVGAFFDDEVDHLVGIDGRNEISIYLGAVGRIE